MRSQREASTGGDLESPHQGPAAPPGRRLTLAVFAVALLVRALPLMIHGWAPERVRIVDSGRYLELADRLAAGDGFRLPEPETGELTPELFRTPGYPAALALLDPLPGSREDWVLALQILADAAGAALCFGLVSAWASRRAGLVAAALWVFDPAHLVYSNLLMADVFGAFLALLAWALVESAGEPEELSDRQVTARALAAGLCASGAVAMRPVLTLLALPLAARAAQKRFRKEAVAVLLFAALLFPLAWSVRNGRLAGAWTVSTAFDLNLALVTAAKVEARAQGLPRSAAEERVMARARQRAQERGQQLHHACREVAREVVSAASGAALSELASSAVELALAGERRYLRQALGWTESVPGLTEGERDAGSPWARLAHYGASDRLLVLGQAAFMALVWCAAALGFVRLWRGGRVGLALVLAAAIVLVLGPSLVVATGRLRLPVSFLIYALAGIGVDRAARRLGRRPGI